MIGIAKKLITPLVWVTILLAISIGTSYLIMKDLVNVVEDVQAISRMVELTGDLQLQVDRLLMPPNDYLITGNIKERDKYDRIAGKMRETLQQLRQQRGNEMWDSLLKKINEDVKKLAEMASEIFHIKNPVANKEAAVLMERMDAFGDRLIDEVGEYHKVTEKELLKKEELSRLKKKKAYTIFAVVMLMSLFSLPLLYIYLSRYVTKPILTLYDGARAVGTGHLGHRITIKTGDEIETLADGFNEMAASMEEARKELDRRLLELYTLYHISKVLNTSFETEQLLVRIVTDIGNNLNIHRVMIMMLDEKTQELYPASFTDFVKEGGLHDFRRRVGQGLYGLAAQNGMPRLIRDVDAEPNLSKEDAISPDIRSIIVAPFGVRNKILGLLCAFKNRPETFEWHDLELFTTVAEHIAVSMENVRLYQETKLQAITDGLTGLYNHRFFRANLTVEIERASRYGHKLSLIILDIDHFKNYNDAHGHPQGDELLRGVAEFLRKGIRESDFACRYGGEEFAVILPETGKDAALALAERIRKNIAEHPFPFRETQPMGTISVSAGVAAFPADSKNIDDLIKKADKALYRAKDEGRNRVYAV
ncbi:MAG: diguanylate cyclase [Deltaproteobacteria bacterium]|nr:diguanylate cyclase [Deltaproteobacteria bacterium]